MPLWREREPTFWDDLNPLWMLRARPSDFAHWNGATSVLCRGIYHPLGPLGLLVAHWASFRWLAWRVVDGEFQPPQLLALIPLLLLWVLLVSADVRFRLQRPTLAERDGFDSAVLDWCGFILYLAVSRVALPLGGVLAGWHYLSRLLG